jgi:hypothetical protein
LAASGGVVEADLDADEWLSACRTLVDDEFDGGESGVAGVAFAVADADERRAEASGQSSRAGLARLQAFDHLVGVDGTEWS